MFGEELGAFPGVVDVGFSLGGGDFFGGGVGAVLGAFAVFGHRGGRPWLDGGQHYFADRTDEAGWKPTLLI